jgi:hypothetical protein
MRCRLAAAFVLALAAPALAQDVPECTTTTTTTTTCKGSAAPLAAPAPEQPVQQAPQYPYPAPPQYAYPPPPSAYYPPAPMIPPLQLKSHVVERPRYGLIIAGTAIFAATYMINASIAYLASEGTLAIPVVGPIVYASGHQECCSSDDNRMLNFWMAMDAIVQAVGLTMTIVGALTHTRVTVFDKVAIVPTATSGAGGLAALGHF